MQKASTACYSVSTGSILELVKELTIGQRLLNTPDQLSTFLHDNIFPKIGTFSAEIYFVDSFSGDFFPKWLPGGASVRQRKVPEKIPGHGPLITELSSTGLPLEVKRQESSAEFLDRTENLTHLLIPVVDGRILSALIYLGDQDLCTFSADFMTFLQTLAAVIGSRLKSMWIILKLTESMHAQEYSERIKAALYEISEQAHYSLDLDDLYAELHRIVGTLIHAPNFFIAIAERRRDGQFITFPYYADAYDGHFQGMEMRLNPDRYSITGHLLKTRKPLLLTPANFAQSCAEHNIECVGTPPHSWLGAPFYLNHIEGAVAVQSYNRVIYTEKDKKLMAFVARHIGEALNRKRAVHELKVAKESAEQAEKNKSIFLANMSHEIRTPMNGILGLTELVLSGTITGQQRTYLEMVYSSANRLLKLINDILDFSKIEAGKFMLEINPFSLRHTIAGPLEILAISAAEKNIELSIDCDDHIPDLLMGDADKLSQILINLLGNGVKFTDRGSVRLIVNQHGQTTVENNDYVDLDFRIKDSGIGIPQDKLKHVFKAFKQLSTTRNSNQRGSGLGLVIAAELVEMMGGQICVDSKPGMGTCFYFTVRFPLAKGSMPATGRPGESIPAVFTSQHRQPLHILLVEDEYINRTLASTVLEREGWRVSVADNGRQALEMVATEDFDLVLMDIQMPELDGYETTRSIRRKEGASANHLPIIAMTAYATKGDRDKCLAAGMDGYIPKPIHPSQLRDQIEHILKRHP